MFSKNMWTKFLNIFLLIITFVLFGFYYNNIPIKIVFGNQFSGTYSVYYDTGNGYNSNNVKSNELKDVGKFKVFLPYNTKNFKIEIDDNKIVLSSIKISKNILYDNDLYNDIDLIKSFVQKIDSGDIEITSKNEKIIFELKSAQKIIIKRQFNVILLCLLGLFASLLIPIFVFKFLQNEKILAMFKQSIIDKRIYKFLFYFSLLISVFVLFRWLNYPITDLHGFRQAQTAITSLFMFDNFNLFSYQTPVLGFPWSIPFEFPIYQFIVALLSKLTHIDLTICGRLVSWIFYILTLYPVYKITKNFTKDKTLFYIISSLYLISPIYLFWSKTFMIETMTVFFGVMFLYFIIKMVDENNFNDFILGLTFSILCILSKATTYPLFVFAGGVYWLFVLIKKRNLNIVSLVKILIITVISLVVTIIWVKHTDMLKCQNLIGNFLISKNLISWNYGSMQQRLSISTYGVILFERIIPNILGNIINFVLIIVTFLITPKIYKKLFVTFVILFCIPIAIFLNLYFVHSYYFIANSIFLLAGIGVIIYGLFEQKKNIFPFVVFISIWIMMLFSFPLYGIKSAKYGDILDVGNFVKNNTSNNSSIIVLGKDWSSETNFFAHRKGLAVPDFINQNEMTKLLKNPDAFMGNLKVSAIVYYPTDNQKIIDLKEKLISKYSQIKECKIHSTHIYIVK